MSRLFDTTWIDFRQDEAWGMFMSNFFKSTILSLLKKKLENHKVIPSCRTRICSYSGTSDIRCRIVVSQARQDVQDGLNGKSKMGQTPKNKERRWQKMTPSIDQRWQERGNQMLHTQPTVKSKNNCFTQIDCWEKVVASSSSIIASPSSCHYTAIIKGTPTGGLGLVN